MKVERQATILRLIQDHDIETQEELTELLQRNNFNVTQATVSRDIRDLKLIKVMTENNIYKYFSPSPSDIHFDDRILDIFRQVVLKVDYAGNFICLHTIRGMANAAAVTIDSIMYSEILGCIAGDDTIFVLTRNEEKAAELVNYFKTIIK